ncbi:MAG: ArsR family transcriptional regulator [Candidatus Omnitrophota bacterium]|nr:MAG: ArsR family transcriptional regulator [Candidatus Omnitrophota bacterium]
MINKLFSSRARVDVLKLFFFNPENSFYQRQISKLSGQSIRGVQREVTRLEELGIIEKSIEGNRIYYKVNKNCPIFKELKNILFKSVGIAQVLKGHLKSDEIKVAFIYGSYARNRESLLSDIDLMVIGKISSRELSHLLSKPKKELMREINYVVFSPKEFKERIRQKDHFLNSVLKDRKIFIVGDTNELNAVIKSR